MYYQVHETISHAFLLLTSITNATVASLWPTHWVAYSAPKMRECKRLQCGPAGNSRFSDMLLFAVMKRRTRDRYTTRCCVAKSLTYCIRYPAIEDSGGPAQPGVPSPEILRSNNRTTNRHQTSYDRPEDISEPSYEY